jgi:DDE superfamily endonuclease
VERPSLHAETCQSFMDAFAEAFPDRRNLLLLNNREAHTAQRLRWPENVRGVRWPPYGPELNPIARVWRDLQDAVAWEQCTDLAAHLVSVGPLLQGYDAPTLQSLTGYPYLVEAIHALCL